MKISSELSFCLNPIPRTTRKENDCFFPKKTTSLNEYTFDKALNYVVSFGFDMCFFSGIKAACFEQCQDLDNTIHHTFSQRGGRCVIFTVAGDQINVFLFFRVK
jgi:hypothetical protein